MAENDQKQEEGTHLNGAAPPTAAQADGKADAKPEAKTDARAETAQQKPDPLAEQAATIARLTEEKRELNDRMLRIAADFENFKRRSRKEMEDAGVRGLEGLLKDILPVIDNLDRALMTAPKGDKVDHEALFNSLHQGVGLVQKQFLGALERSNIKSFDAQGKPFDPSFHEAVAQVDSETLPPGTVAVVYQRGYTAGSRLLRPAMVAVVKPRAAAPAPEPAVEILDVEAEQQS